MINCFLSLSLSLSLFLFLSLSLSLSLSVPLSTWSTLTILLRIINFRFDIIDNYYFVLPLKEI